MTGLRVGVDLDGVGHRFEQACAKAFLAQGWAHPLLREMAAEDGQARRWHWYEDVGMTLAEFLAACHRAADDGLLFTGHAWDGFAAALDRIRAAGHEVHIVTDRSFGSRPEVSQDLTRAWLTELGAAYDSLTFSSDKTSVPTDVFIEDKPSNYDALRAAGVACYLVTRPWNAEHPVPPMHRVRSVVEFADLVCDPHRCVRCRRMVGIGCSCGLPFAEKMRTVGMTLGDFRAVRS